MCKCALYVHCEHCTRFSLDVLELTPGISCFPFLGIWMIMCGNLFLPLLKTVVNYLQLNVIEVVKLFNAIP